MIFAVVVKYTNGQTHIDYISQNAITSTRGNSCLHGFIDSDKATGHLLLIIEYAAEIYHDNKVYPIKRGVLTIDTNNAETVQIFNCDAVNGKYMLSSVISTPFIK